MSALTNRNGNRSKPLQASTNIIHTKIPRRIDNNQTTVRDAIKAIQNVSLPGPVKVPLQTSKDPVRKVKPKFDENAVVGLVESQDKSGLKTPAVEQVGENAINSLVKNAYNVLEDVHPLDEKLFQKVMSLELADDGLPSYITEEPFDF